MQSIAHFLRALFLIAFSTSTLVSAAAISEASPQRIAVRAIIPGTPLNDAQACIQYSTVANLSIIGGNSSYRAAFLDSSPVGTLHNAAMMNLAIATNKLLMFDPLLNQVCGNATAIAIAEAATNFTQNIVAQFTFVGNPSSIIVGPIIAILVGVTLLIFGTLTAL